VFERFYQVDASSTRRYGGMGLGLAIVRETLAAQEREITVESEVGVGTTFRFSLPLARLPEVEVVAAEEDAAAAEDAVEEEAGAEEATAAAPAEEASA